MLLCVFVMQPGCSTQLPGLHAPFACICSSCTFSLLTAAGATLKVCRGLTRLSLLLPLLLCSQQLKLWRPMEKPDTSLTLGYTPLLPSPSQAPAAQRFTLEVAPSGKQLTSDTYEVDFVPCLPATSTTSKPVMGDTAQYAVVPQLAADGSWGLAAVLVGYTWVGASSGEEPLVSASWEVEAAFKEARSMAEVSSRQRLCDCLAALCACSAAACQPGDHTCTTCYQQSTAAAPDMHINN